MRHENTPGLSDIMRCEFRWDLEAYLARSAAARRTLEEIVAFYDSDPARFAPYGIACLREALAADPDVPEYAAALGERARLRAQIGASLTESDAC